MKSTSCEICRDLIPLVVDEVAGTDSKQYDAAHIQTCAVCRKYYNQLHDSTQSNSNKTNDLAVLNALRASQIKQLLGAAISGFAAETILGLLVNMQFFKTSM